MADTGEVAGDEFLHAEVPTEFKALRACMRCALIKTLTQFYENGCENCEFLGIEGNQENLHSVYVAIHISYCCNTPLNTVHNTIFRGNDLPLGPGR